MTSSNPAPPNNQTAKASNTTPDQQQQQQPPAKSTATLGEDDEFEDFPVDDWPTEETEAANGDGATQHLWEESWDDDDTSDDFSTQLREELKKVEASKKR